MQNLIPQDAIRDFWDSQKLTIFEIIAIFEILTIFKTWVIFEIMAIFETLAIFKTWAIFEITLYGNFWNFGSFQIIEVLNL